MTAPKLHSHVTGTGSPIVVLHGMLGSTAFWEPLTKFLQSKNRVIALDLLGFGDSPKPENSDYSTQQHTEAILRTLDELKVSEPIILVGHSMGAILALSFASRYPKNVARLVLMNMPIYADRAEARRSIVQSKLVPRLMYYGPTARLSCTIMCQFRPIVQRLIPHFLNDLPRAVAIDATKHTWYSYSRSMRQIIEEQSVIDELSTIKMPVSLVFGSDDNIANSRHIDDLVSKRPNVSVTTLPATHQLPLELPEQAAAIVVA
ncbi:MAG: alpha/beta hydrolase [Candidatus Saccharimonadales bacterium]